MANTNNLSSFNSSADDTMYNPFADLLSAPKTEESPKEKQTMEDTTPTIDLDTMVKEINEQTSEVAAPTEKASEVAEPKKRAVDPHANINKLAESDLDTLNILVEQSGIKNLDYTQLGALLEMIKDIRATKKEENEKNEAIAKVKAKAEAAARGVENAKALGDGVGKIVVVKTGTYHGIAVIEKKGAKTYTVRCTQAWKKSHALKRDAKYVKPENITKIFDNAKDATMWLMSNGKLKDSNFDINIVLDNSKDKDNADVKDAPKTDKQ